MSVPDWMIDAPAASVDDLAMLVRKLAHSLRKAAPGHALPDQAVDYLRRHHLDGSPLRDATPSPAVSAEPVALTEYDISVLSAGLNPHRTIVEGNQARAVLQRLADALAQPQPGTGSGKS